MRRLVATGTMLSLIATVCLFIVWESAPPRVVRAAYQSPTDIPAGGCVIERLAPRGQITTWLHMPPSREWALAAIGSCGHDTIAEIAADEMVIIRGGGVLYNDMVQEYFGVDAVGHVRFTDADDAFTASVVCANGRRFFIRGALGGPAGDRYFFVETSPRPATK